MAQPMCRLRIAQHLCRQRLARLTCRQRLARLRLQLQQVVQHHHQATRGRHCDVELHCRRRQNPPLPSRSILSHAALGSSPIAADVASKQAANRVVETLTSTADRYSDSSHCVAAQTAAMATSRADHCSSTMMPTMMPPKAGRATWLLHVAGGSVPWEAPPSL